MNTKLYILLAAGALALSACNSPTAEQTTDEAAAQAEVAGDQAAAAADAAGEAAAASAEAAAAAGAAAVGSAAAAVDAAADPVQAAYEEGKANAAGAIADRGRQRSHCDERRAHRACPRTGHAARATCQPASVETELSRPAHRYSPC